MAEIVAAPRNEAIQNSDRPIEGFFGVGGAIGMGDRDFGINSLVTLDGASVDGRLDSSTPLTPQKQFSRSRSMLLGVILTKKFLIFFSFWRYSLVKPSKTLW